MEETYSYPKLQTFSTKSPPTNTNPQKNHFHFMYKAIIFVIFVLILPLFSSQSSETMDKTWNWEFLKLIFVGLAVSYGLFSRKNDKAEENHQRLEKTDSVLTSLFHVSSFFDEETENQSGYSENCAVEMWKSQYLKTDPLVVFEKENSVLEKQRSTNCEVGEKPLFLPVRSLKSRVTCSDSSEKINVSCRKRDHLRKSSSNSGSKHLPMDFNISRNWELGEIYSLDFKGEAEKSYFPQSSIKCNSKSDVLKAEKKNETNGAPLFPLHSLSPSPESKARDSIGNRSSGLLKQANSGKSVRTIRKHESVSGDLGNRGFVEEKGMNLVSERKTSLKIFDFRDYEKGKTEEKREKFEFGKLESEGFDSNIESGEARDVDKKADEFIAKFREQIRLQRTESFKR